MIEILTVLCLYPITYKDGTTKHSPIMGEIISQNTSHMIQTGMASGNMTDAWKINFTKTLKQLGVLEFNQPVMFINSNSCLVKERKEVNYEPE